MRLETAPKVEDFQENQLALPLAYSTLLPIDEQNPPSQFQLQNPLAA
jgi:hypothetical protein